MSNVMPLASGPITTVDQLGVELIQTIETPEMILIRWPSAPSVSDPRRFPAVALAVIALMDQAMIRLAEIGPGGQ